MNSYAEATSQVSEAVVAGLAPSQHIAYVILADNIAASPNFIYVVRSEEKPRTDGITQQRNRGRHCGIKPWCWPENGSLLLINRFNLIYSSAVEMGSVISAVANGTLTTMRRRQEELLRWGSIKPLLQCKNTDKKVDLQGTYGVWR